MKNKQSLALAITVLILSSLACNYLTQGSSPREVPTTSQQTNSNAGSSLISNIFLTNDLYSTVPMTAFHPTDTIYVIFYVNDPQYGAAYEVQWYVLDSPQNDPTTPFNTASFTANGSGDHFYADLQSSEPSGLAPSTYKVEIYIDNVKAAEQEFTVVE
ncbi:MAG: hypothetical protein H6634_04300 [Anaerolineales bacterium]|nr:hypothetical protein [Anaerolineales bacterium]